MQTYNSELDSQKEANKLNSSLLPIGQNCSRIFKILCFPINLYLYVFPGWSWALFQQKLWLLFAFWKEALESALPKFYSLKRTDGLPNIWQFFSGAFNTLWRALHVFSKPSVPLMDSCTFQQAPNPLPHVWIFPFPFCSFLWYFYKNFHRPQHLCEGSFLCNFSTIFPLWNFLFFSIL